jgi:hypothetical protein
MRLSWFVLFGLAACSPYSYPKEVSAISTGVDQLSDGFTSGYAALAADRTAQVQLDLTSARAKVTLPKSCSNPQSQLPCTLYRFGGTEPTLSAIEQDRDKTMVALGVLKDYAHALAAVTNAADRTSYDAAVAQLSGAVGALAKNADAVAPGVSTVAPAIVNIVGWLVGTALDQQRFDSLKAAITAVGTPQANGNIPINTVAMTLGDGLLALSTERQTVLGNEADALVKPLGPSLSDAAYRQRLSDAQAVVVVLDGLRRADPIAAAKGLVKAHKALVAAVNDPSRNYPALLKAVGDFVDQATALQTALTTTTTLESTPAKKGK